MANLHTEALVVAGADGMYLGVLEAPTLLAASTAGGLGSR